MRTKQKNGRFFQEQLKKNEDFKFKEPCDWITGLIPGAFWEEQVIPSNFEYHKPDSIDGAIGLFN